MKKEFTPDPPPDVPVWLMTYSDVITLLMTFFILLLTFATSEPERFERLQISLFGGGGATGIAGDYDGPLENDSLLIRQRPRSSRLATKGAQAAPMESDPAVETIAAGLAGIDEEPDPAERYSIDLPLTYFVSSDGQVTNLGAQRLRMVARQLKKSDSSISLHVTPQDDLARVLALAAHLVDVHGVRPGQVGIGKSSTGLPGRVRLMLTQHFRGS